MEQNRTKRKRENLSTEALLVQREKDKNYKKRRADAKEKDGEVSLVKSRRRSDMTATELQKARDQDRAKYEKRKIKLKENRALRSDLR